MQQLTLAILDQAADEGLRMIKTIRSSLDTWEAFRRDHQELIGHLRAAHRLGPSCRLESPRT